jgi:membrane protein insertase Oxa1/YidC/SpoIIIJ
MLMGRLKSSEKQKRKKERKMTPMMPLARIMMLLHLRVGLSLYVIPKQASQALEAS